MININKTFGVVTYNAQFLKAFYVRKLYTMNMNN
jgi:hypothetical protein